MPRSSRITLSGGFYHVFNRGVNKEPICIDQTDYDTFLRRLEALRTMLQYDHSIYAYILMPNHFHLLLQTRKTPLAKIMTSLLTSYSMRFNRRHHRIGVVFQNRFRSKICDTDSYFLGGARYIMLNAIHAGLAKSLEEYPWSSYKEIFDTSPYQIIDQNEVERLIGESVQNKKHFREFLVDGIKLENLESEYGFDREIDGPALFASLTRKKYLRRQRRK